MKNIAIIIHKLYGGGAEHAACNLSLFLEAHFHTTLIAFDARNAAYPHTDDTIDIGIPSARSFLQRLLLLPRRVLRLGSIKRQRHICASVALLPGPSMASALARQKNERIIMSVRNHLSSQEGSTGLSALKTRITAKLSDCVVAVSRVAALDLEQNFGIPRDKLHVIYNAVDPTLLPQQCDESAPWLTTPGKCIVTMGRLHAQKGHWHLLRAMKAVIEQIPDAKLLILGDGEYRQRLLTLAEDLGISQNVYFPGYITAPHGYVRKADVFVLSSLYEGMPNAMLEAMACGVPVVAADCPSGPREILSPDSSITHVAKEIEHAPYGILLPPLSGRDFSSDTPLSKEEQLLAQALIQMLSDDSLREAYAQKARLRASDFSPEQIAAQWASLIQSLTE